MSLRCSVRIPRRCSPLPFRGFDWTLCVITPDHCDKEGLPRPELCHELAPDDKTNKPFKVWIVMGKERLELPTSFPTLVVGQERVAKSVLGRLRAQSKKKAA